MRPEDVPLTRLLAQTCLALWHHLEETVSDLQTIRVALTQRGLVFADEELREARETVDEENQLEMMRPEVAAMRRVFERFKQLDQGLAALEEMGQSNPHDAGAGRTGAGPTGGA